MQNNNENQNVEAEEMPHAAPMQIGMNEGQVEELTQEISHTGVAQSEADVERLGVPGPETGEDNTSGNAFPIPIVTSG